VLAGGGTGGVCAQHAIPLAIAAHTMNPDLIIFRKSLLRRFSSDPIKFGCN
jgi:hypothetical protein